MSRNVRHVRPGMEPALGEGMKSEARDKATGRYADSKLEKPCRCGHTLGQHSAEKAGNERPCFAAGCDCGCFKKAKS